MLGGGKGGGGGVGIGKVEEPCIGWLAVDGGIYERG